MTGDAASSGPALILALYDEDHMDALDWQDQALCAQTDPEAFFPEKGGSTRDAKRVCRSCDVRAECLEYALEHEIRFGIWGGMSEQERRRLGRTRAAPASPVPQPEGAAALCCAHSPVS
jgi:WhiB family transcriptional regulator, redox-sensing transcriptional regulator